MNKKRKKQEGQALFEFIIFVPLLLILFVLFLTLAGSINGSINQQKATRGYFYNLNKGNSFLPSQDDLDFILSKGPRFVGAYSIGWAYEFDGESPIAPCFRISSFLNNVDREECKKKLEGATRTHQIRVYTMYGLCSASFQVGENDVFEYNPRPGNIQSTCMLR